MPRLRCIGPWARTASSQHQRADALTPDLARSATGRLPLPDDSSSRGWAVKEGTRGQEGG